MKKILTIIGVAALLATVSARAQTNTTPGINIPGINLSNGATNWAAIPFFKYDLQKHSAGYGGALLYKVSDSFWTGVRLDRINGVQTTAGVQAQIQTTVTWSGIKFTPFLEASVGLGSSSLYGSAGPGVFFMFYDHKLTSSTTLNIGLCADYEHVVYGAGKTANEANIGPLLNISF
jgi:hypothetical protein